MSVDPPLKVLEGLEGYLFLSNDTNRVLDQVEGSYRLDERQIYSIALTHAARRLFCRSLGATYHHVLVPDKENVLPQHLPDVVKPARYGPRPVMQYREAGASKLHNFLYEPGLLARKADTPSYPEADTHWTWDGAYRYTKRMLKQFGSDASLIALEDASEHSYEHPGDLGIKLGRPPSTFRLRISKDPAVRPVYDNRLPNVGRLRITQNPKRPSEERWIVMHDSFGEIPALLLPLCAAKICFIHVSDFDEIFVRSFRPNKVIMLQVERFFVRTPLNGADWMRLIAQQHAARTEGGEDVPALSDEIAFS